MWRDFASLPRFMHNLEAVHVSEDGKRSHWVAKGPAGTRIEWDAELTQDEANTFLAWRSLEGADVDNAGAVRFIPDNGGRGTIVSVTMQYKPPAGAVGAAVARLLGDDADQQVGEDLRRFKRLLETGELPTTEGQSHGPRPAWYQAFGGDAR
jgi:uncharacterized membrane protein